MEKKKVNQEELENINGGAGKNGDDYIYCSHCGHKFDMTSVETRSVSTSACTSDIEYKCPSCSQWTR